MILIYIQSNLQSKRYFFRLNVLFSFSRGDSNSISENKASVYDITRIITLDDHGSTVWKVSWNVFGSVLYSCGDDGRIRMWKGWNLKRN